MSEENAAIQTKRFFAKVQNKYNRMARQNIKEQIDGVVLSIEKELEKIECLSGGKETKILHETIRDTKACCRKIDNLAKELSNPFLLFIVGTGKFGKSTLINSLLECEIAETDMLPKTWKIDVFYGGNGNKAEIRYADGHSELKSFSDTKKIIAEEEKKREASEEFVQEEFDKTKGYLKTIQAKKEKLEELRKYKLYKSDIVEVHWPVASNDLLRNFRLVDTPGIKQNLSMGHIDASAADYYGKADGIIWLLAADKISAKETRDSIEEVLNHFGKRTDNIIAVLNKIDLVEQNGGLEAVVKTLHEANKLYGDIFNDIIPISAGNALKGILKKDLRRIEKSGLPQLIAVINRRFYKKAQGIQITSKIGGTNSILGDVREKIGEFIEHIDIDENRRRKLQEEWNLSAERTRELAFNRIDSCCREQIDMVKRKTKELENQLYDMDNKDRNSFLQEKVFNNKDLGKKIDVILSQTATNIQRMKEFHMKESVFFEYPNLQKELAQNLIIEQKENIDNLVKNGSFDTDDNSIIAGGIAALGAAALLGPIGLLAFFFGGFLSRILNNLPEKISNQYEIKLNSVKNGLKHDVEKMLLEAGTNVEAVREGTFAELYGPSSQANEIKDHMRIITMETKKEFKLLRVKDIIFNNAEKYYEA